MNRDTANLDGHELELTLETLDQWETELDEFAAGIMQRLSQISGKTIDTSALIPNNQSYSAEIQEPDHADDDSEAMQLLQSLREMTQ